MIPGVPLSESVACGKRANIHLWAGLALQKGRPPLPRLKLRKSPAGLIIRKILINQAYRTHPRARQLFFSYTEGIIFAPLVVLFFYTEGIIFLQTEIGTHVQRQFEGERLAYPPLM